MEGAAFPAVARDDEWSRRLTRFFGRCQAAAPEVELPVADASPCRADSIREAFFVAIASGKGGTGKSFLATNLAVALWGPDRRVTVVDCDFGLANDHLLLGVNPSRSVQQFFAGVASLRDLCVPTPFGPELLPGGSGISRLGDLTEGDLLRLANGLGSLAVDRDVMLLDCAAGISPQCILTLLAAQQVVVVTNPEIAALTDAYALIKCVSGHGAHPPIGVVVNRVASERQGEATFRKLADVSARFSSCEIHYLGSIPEEPAVTQQRLNQPPLIVSHPTCQASRAMQQVLAVLEERVGGVRQRVLPAGETVARRFRQILSRHRRRH